jgi:hypothetical protein
MTSHGLGDHLVDDLACRLHAIDHRRRLARHDRAHLEVALAHAQCELAAAEDLDLLGTVLAVELAMLLASLFLMTRTGWPVE